MVRGGNAIDLRLCGGSPIAAGRLFSPAPGISRRPRGRLLAKGGARSGTKWRCPLLRLGFACLVAMCAISLLERASL
jgi:hypothetical protein